MQYTSERILIKELQKGDGVAMEKFFRRYSPYLYAVCLRYVPEADRAKDLLHDSILKIFTTIKKFKITDKDSDSEIERSLKAWSARVTANLALNYLRDNSRLQFEAIDDHPDIDIPDEEIEVEDLSAETLSRLIEELPPPWRTVFNLFAIEGFSHREISKMLGISESLSATQYHRARNELKRKIREIR